MALKVAQVLSPTELVINAGTNEGIKKGQRYQIYSLGDEIIDPETGESLGILENIKGIGRVINVQDKMATLESDVTEPTAKFIRRSSSPVFVALGQGWEERIPPPVKADFKDPTCGDLVRPI
jgi:hypothetical protein